MTDHSIQGETGPLPADDLTRSLTVTDPDDPILPHLSLVGDNYTVLVSGEQTGGRYCLIDMLVPDGGGPPPHRHDFEEMFTIIDGEIEFTFRGETITAAAGTTVKRPVECAACVQEHFGEGRAAALHVHTRRTGGILPGRRRAG